jgi:hypothetical protein
MFSSGIGMSLMSRWTSIFPERYLNPLLEYAPNQQSVVPSDEDIIYGDFVILASASEVPVFSQSVPWIEICDGDPNSPLRGESIMFDTIESLSQQCPFPIYKLQQIPEGMIFREASILRYKANGEVFSAQIDYGLEDQAADLDQRISIIALAVFPKPFPVSPIHKPLRLQESDLWEQGIIEEVFPTPIADTPTPGLILPSAMGDIVMWIENNTYYLLISENSTERNNTLQVVSELAQGEN